MNGVWEVLDFSYGQPDDNGDGDDSGPTNRGAGHSHLLAIEDGDATGSVPTTDDESWDEEEADPYHVRTQPSDEEPNDTSPLNSWNGIDLSGVPSGEGIKLMEPDSQVFEDEDIPPSQPESQLEIPDFEDPVVENPMDEAPVPPTEPISGEPDEKAKMFAVPAPVSPDRVKRKRELMARMEQLRLWGFTQSPKY